MPVGGEFFRRARQFGALACGFFAALLDGGDLRRGAVPALAPGVALAGDGLQAMIGKLGLARQRLRLDADFGAGAALARDGFVDRGKLFFDFESRRQRRKRQFGFFVRDSGFIAGGDDALPRFRERGETRRIATDLALGGGVVLARGIGAVLRVAPLRPRLGLGGGGRGDGSLGGFGGVALDFDVASRGGEFAFDRLQAAAFGEPPRRAGRRMRRDRKAVPAPEIALGRNEPLAGFEQARNRREPRPFGARDDADLGEPPRQLRRRFDVFGQRGDAFRERRIGRIRRRAGPAHRRGFARRRIEIVSQGGAERLLVAFRDRERVHHRRPQIFALDREQLADGLGFGFEPLHAALGRSERRARRLDLGPGLNMGCFRNMRGAFCFGERGLRSGERRRQRRQIGGAGVGRSEVRRRYWRVRLRAARRAARVRAASPAADCAAP